MRSMRHYNDGIDKGKKILTFTNRATNSSKTNWNKSKIRKPNMIKTNPIRYKEGGTEFQKHSCTSKTKTGLQT